MGIQECERLLSRASNGGSVGVCGSGAFIDLVGRLFYGPRHSVDYVHVKERPGEPKEVGIYQRKHTILSAWRNLRTPVSPQYCKAPSDIDDPNVTYKKLSPLKNLHDGINFDGHRIVPVNADGHLIMADGTVYDRAAKKYLTGRDTEIKGYLTLKPRLSKQLRMIATSPEIWIRLSIVLAISAVFDTGIYELGKCKGYKESEKGKVPVAYPRRNDHDPSDTRILASTLSPLPLGLNPLQHLSSATDYYVRPGGGSLYSQESAGTNQQTNAPPQQNSALIA